jgi:2-polyprenyl-3-methyl-5-hydroxy-6-metoxy-1,4-benzoquinol methylase
MEQVGAHEHYRHMACSACDHERFLSLQDSITADLYESDSDYNADLAIAQSHKDMLQWNHIQALPHLVRFVGNKSARVLDIGCFNGFFVKELRDRGIDAVGIDFNRKALAFGRSTYQLEGYLSEQTLENLDEKGDRFDAITMFEVIEHLEDFAMVIAQALRLLRPGGVFILSTPNSRMSWRPALDFPPHHLSRFSPTSVRRLMERAGMVVLSQAEQTSSFDLFRNFLGSLARRKSASSLRGGEFRIRQATNPIRTLANRSKWIIYRVVSPVDSLLHLMGVRYISQIVVAQKTS